MPARVKNLQLDGMGEQFSGFNVIESIETDKDIYFNESYIVIGKLVSARNIHATYDLKVVGDIEADEVLVHGDLFVDGNIKASTVHCTKLICSGKIQVGSLLVDEDAIVRFLDGNKVEISGNLIASDSIMVDEICKSEGHVMVAEGVSGEGTLEAVDIAAGEYIDFDGSISGRIFELSSAEEPEVQETDDEDTKHDNDLNLKDVVERIIDGLKDEEEDDIVEQLNTYASQQELYMEEIRYLFEELVRISYMDEIDNLKDYLIVWCSSNWLPESLRTYETISHVFDEMYEKCEWKELDYTTENLEDFIYSLRIAYQMKIEDQTYVADKIFEFIGLRYDFVKRRFERE